MNVYKNDLDETVRFRIEPHIGTEGIYLELQENGKRATTVFLPKDAPALALAILEAAGYGEEVVTDGSPDGHIQVAKYYLYEGVKAHASITAEARERAELEAEALELFQASCLNGETLPSFEGYPDIKLKWLAVARRAREIRNEKKVTTDD